MKNKMPVLLNDGQCQFGIFTSGRFMLCNQTQKSFYCAQSTKVEYIPPRYVKKLLSQQSTMSILHTYLLHFHIFHFHAPYRIAKNNVILSLFLPTQPFRFKKICQKRLCSTHSFYYVCMWYAQPPCFPPLALICQIFFFS